MWTPRLRIVHFPRFRHNEFASGARRLKKWLRIGPMASASPGR